jgi:iron complex outermembrane receptor protein
MNVIYLVSFGQSRYTFSGRVSDEDDQPLPGVAVILFPHSKGAITDCRGEFFINDLKKGTYRIEFSFIGYQKNLSIQLKYRLTCFITQSSR